MSENQEYQESPQVDNCAFDDHNVEQEVSLGNVADSELTSPLLKEVRGECQIETGGTAELDTCKAELMLKLDKEAGIIRLYDDRVMEQLVDCYIEWPKMPRREDVELMVNGGCVFYQFGHQPYVYGLGLKQGNEGKVLTKEDLPHLIEWFGRFGDLLTRTSYKQDWYKQVILEFQLNRQPYIKSFFTILANIAFCIQNYHEKEVVDVLRCKFQELLQFEIDRDYKKELQEQFDFEKILKDIQAYTESTGNAEKAQERCETEQSPKLDQYRYAKTSLAHSYLEVNPKEARDKLVCRSKIEEAPIQEIIQLSEEVPIQEISQLMEEAQQGSNCTLTGAEGSYSLNEQA